MSDRLEIVALPALPEVGTGGRLGDLIATAAATAGLQPADGDAIVVSQKVVSKAEGRTRSLDSVVPGPRAIELAAETEKDPRLVELVLGESRRIVRAAAGVLIVETNGGWVCANAGIDTSNVPGEQAVTLLPVDPDDSARRLRAELATGLGGGAPAVVVADSFGRPWRLGQVEVAIGCAGLVALDDWNGRHDSNGQELVGTAVAVADQLAGAADLSRDKASNQPVVLIRGIERWWTAADGPGAAALRRPADQDLFR